MEDPQAKPLDHMQGDFGHVRPGLGSNPPWLDDEWFRVLNYLAAYPYFELREKLKCIEHTEKQKICQGSS